MCEEQNEMKKDIAVQCTPTHFTRIIIILRETIHAHACTRKERVEHVGNAEVGVLVF